MAVHDLGAGVRLWTRDEWDAREVSGMSQHRGLYEAFVHHTTDSSAEAVDSLTEQKAAMRRTQAFHMDTRGWSDIGYAFMVFPAHGGLENARVMQGRLTKYIPAAQLGRNEHTVPICVFGNFQGDDPATPDVVTAICRVIQWVKQNHGDSLRTVGGHRDVQATTCPGNALYAKVPEIARRTGLRVF
jgi:hypothetical protein